MLLGRHKKIITPSLPCALAGFAHRTEKAQQKYGELYLRTTVLQDGDSIFCFFAADIIWWDDNLVAMLRRKISKEENIPEEHLHFIATHSHSGPQVSNRFSNQLGQYNEKFTSQLINSTSESVKKAKTDLQDVTISVRKSKIDLGIYRRKLVNGIVEMAPNKSVEIDNMLTVVSFTNKENKEIATWIHYACHPTSTDANIVSGEFPGVCTAELENLNDLCVVSFFQGFSADVRPKLIRDNNFYRGSLEDMISIGEYLFKEVILLKEQPCVHEENIKLKVVEEAVPLMYDNQQLYSDIPPALYEEWKRKKKQHGVEQLKFSYINISENLSLLLANAEMAQGYGKALKNMNKSVLPTAYSNGMVGYISTKIQLKNGGYEAETSIFYFALKGKLHPEMEKIINEQFYKLKENLYAQTD